MTPPRVFSFSVNGTAYQAQALDARAQGHVIRRLLMVLHALAGIVEPLRELAVPGEDGQPRVLTIEEIADLFAPVVRELARLSDEDTDYILDACADATRYQVGAGAGWQRVRESGVTNNPLVNDQLVQRLGIAYNVLSETFSVAFASLGIDLKSAMAAAAPAMRVAH